MNKIGISTIGFTKTSAERFFARLIENKINKVVDVRLNNKSQLAGFAKSNDLSFFLKKIASIDYVHLGILAPKENMLSDYRKGKESWDVYSGRFLSLMDERKIENNLNPRMFEGACLLCSEDEPQYCHRRLVCDYLNVHWNGILDVRHL